MLIKSIKSKDMTMSKTHSSSRKDGQQPLSNDGDPFQPGQLIPGKGVFLGIWSPKDRRDRSLNKTFNIFAAPYDLGLDENGQGKKLLVQSNDGVRAVGEIKNLMGHNGAEYKNDTELYKALRNGTYNGEWFIPPRDLVNGTKAGGKKVQNDNLYQHRNTGKLAGTFVTDGASVLTHHWYRSATEPSGGLMYNWIVDFTDGHGVWGGREVSLPLRVVRAELRP